MVVKDVTCLMSAVLSKEIGESRSRLNFTVSTDALLFASVYSVVPPFRQERNAFRDRDYDQPGLRAE
jgi:hypothetical protein